MNYRRISFYRSHNLEVPGSSPGWSTLEIKHLREIASAFFFICVNKGSVRFSDFWMKVLLIFLFVYTDGIGIGCIDVMCDAIQ